MDAVEELRPLTTAEALLRNLVKAQLSEQYKALDIYWRQRYHFKLCKFGDENTKFFHASASARLRKNQIKLLHGNEVPIYSHVGKENILSEFYTALLGTSTQTTWNFDLDALYPNLRSLSSLDEPFTEEEIKNVLWHMRADSSPGPDGFRPAFFKSFWPTVKEDIMYLCNEFHSGHATLQCINQAYIVLLPKRRM